MGSSHTSPAICEVNAEGSAARLLSDAHLTVFVSITTLRAIYLVSLMVEYAPLKRRDVGSSPIRGIYSLA